MAKDTEWHDLDDALPGCYPTFSNLSPYLMVGGRCSQCMRITQLDRDELARTFGFSCYITQLSSKLKCERCGHRGTNKFVVAHLPR
jgi:hypothetical protein